MPARSSTIRCQEDCESNQLEKAKPVEREPVVPAPTLSSVFGVPQQRISLADELKSDHLNTRQILLIHQFMKRNKNHFNLKHHYKPNQKDQV